MSSLSTTIASGFVNQYTDFGLRVHRLAEDLSEKQFWIKPHSYGNSFGNLVLLPPLVHSSKTAYTFFNCDSNAPVITRKFHAYANISS